jgi:hypothetical protein
MRASAAALALLLCAAQPGCLTQRTYDHFTTSPIESGWIELVESDSQSVRLRVSIDYAIGQQREGVVEFDPRLGNCESTRILLRSRHEIVPLELGVRQPLVVDAEASNEDAPVMSGLGLQTRVSECTVAVVSTVYAEDVSLVAQNLERNLGSVLIPPPKNVWVLALLLPATAAVDVATFGPRVIVKCFSGGEESPACLAFGIMVLGAVFDSSDGY